MVGVTRPPQLWGVITAIWGAHTAHMSNFALLRALACEQRAGDASDQAVKKEWEALAIEWHLLVNTSAKAADKEPRPKSG